MIMDNLSYIHDAVFVDLCFSLEIKLEPGSMDESKVSHIVFASS